MRSSTPDMDAAQFKALVSDYAALHRRLAEAGTLTRELRTRSKEMQANILEYMQEHDIDECALPNSRLVRKRTKRTEGLKKEHIEGELKQILGESGGEGVERAVANMYNRRLTDIQETLAVLKQDHSEEQTT